MTASRLLFTLAAVAMALLFTDAARADDNDVLLVKIAALIGSHNLALPISFVPDPVFGIPASAVTFGTNLGLKDTRAIFITPGDWSSSPNTEDGCHYQFDLPQSTADYSNLLGFINLKNVPGNWGELTRTGLVQVVHANTDVKVHAANPHILPDRRQSQSVTLAPGHHPIEWRAETQISDAFDIIVPAVLLGFNSIKYGASVANQGWSAARQTTAQAAARQVIIDISLETGLVAASQLFETRTSVVHERDQQVTIYKLMPPELTISPQQINLEATDFGGVLYERVADQLRLTVDASDPCGRSFTLSNDAGPLLNIGSNLVTWTVRDTGPLPGGGVNIETEWQNVIVTDTQAPILVPPPSRVIEVPASYAGLDASEVELGPARVVDLADPDPTVSNDGPAFYPINSRSAITWTATDASGNSSFADQLITIKAEGANTAPTVSNVSTTTLTSEPVDIVLSGQDPDFLDGRFDPLSFRISQRPSHGEFVAPLYPFFIEDYRTSPGGPYGEAFYLSGNHSVWLTQNVCNVGTAPPPDRIAVDWVYEPEFVHVDDHGKVYMVDYFWQCFSGGAVSAKRMSTWDRDGNFIGQIPYQGFNDAFVLDRDGYIYEIRSESSEIFVTRCATDFVGKATRAEFCQSLGKIQSNSAPEIHIQSVSYARVDSSQGLLYVTDKRRVFVFDIRNDPPNPIYLATLNATAFPTPGLTSCAGSSSLGYALEIDSTGALYMVNCANQRIEKFTASRFDDQGNLVPGEYVGWMGRCESSSNNACDEDKQISKGFACTDATCTRTETAGNQPGQFSAPLYVALDPNDLLYVAEWENYRVQRFAADGTFAGQAISPTASLGKEDPPAGFVLGNMGRPLAVSVNATQFYVVDQEEGFVHVFETSPLKDITDNSATVTYVSNFNFHSETDSFRFVATDGLADSNVGMVFIDVARNFRAPIAHDQSLTTLEDIPIDITLTADDPDGILGFDFNGLDILNYQIIEQPLHGTLTSVTSDNATLTLTYTPDPDYYGTDQFVFIANDGFDDSGPASVDIEVIYVDDPPRIVANELPPRIGLGFPFMLRSVWTDDGDENPEDYFTAVVWNGETTIVEGGINDDDPDNPFIEGVLLIRPVNGKGTGYGIAQHTFTTPGPKTVRFCILAGGSYGECLTSHVTPELLVNLGLELPDDQGESPPPDVPAGETFTINVIVGNLEPEGVAGLVAQAIALHGTISAPGVYFTGSSEGNCTISPGAQTINCDFGNFTVGEQRMITLSFATDPAMVDDVLANIRLSFTTSSEAVNEQTEAWLTRSIINTNRIFRDRLEESLKP